MFERASVDLTIKKNDLLDLAREKVLDAEALLNAGRLDGSAYICGYAVELFLKYRLCKQLKWSEFPSTNNDFKLLQSLKTHNLEVLLRFSGIEAKINRTYFAEWSILLQWSPENRYNEKGKVTATDASEMIQAAKAVMRNI